MEIPGFVEDIFFKSLLFGVTIRSPVARGRLISIECPRLPNSYTLITAAGIPGINELEETSMPILAGDTLSYIGEPVAILVGPDEAKLEEYAALCKVAAGEEPPVFSSRDIYEKTTLAERVIAIGDAEKAFAEAKTIVSGDYATGIQEHWYAEPTGAAAHFDFPRPEKDKSPEEKQNDNKTPPVLVIHTATQWPFHVKRSVARLLNIDTARVRVEPTLIGIHMDGKFWYPSLIACHAALGTFITKKPVKMMLTREEDFRYSPKRAGTEIRISSALGETGDILGTEVSVTVNMGAHGVFADEILDQTCLGSIGHYRMANVKFCGSAVKTNIPPQGPFSGFGLAQGFFAMERHISHIADIRRQDPAEWRKNNHIDRNGHLPIGVPLKNSPPAEQLLDTAAAMSDYYRKWASFELLRIYRRQNKWTGKEETLRGIGIALGYQGCGLLYSGTDKGNYSVELTLGKDGFLEIKTSMVTSDDDYSHLWARIAAEILSIDPGKVKAITQNTENPDSGPASASRNITVLTKLVERACLAIRKQRFRDPLPITVRRACHPARNRGDEGFFPPPRGKTFDSNSLAHLGWGAAVVEVEINPIEYTPRIRGAWMGIDGGRILSEKRARRSLRSSAVQALGWASWEQIVYADGIIPGTLDNNYKIPNPLEIPPIFIDFIWNDSEDPKGIGELPFNCIPAAYLQAVSQAMDHHFQRIPLTAKDVWEAVKLKAEEPPL
ncbi:MAG: molybdopterin-dependent oxidoreductase [Treponema sp.]|jgi:CO/xanthine dehydrogenase Mo-binding subunit|nr:molybdopterin-dependent oxidoreductase [Treponema sp.]